MPEPVLMIALSPTMETGTIARWRKKEGEAVASGDVLCEVETDKATMDYESTAEGTLLKILLPDGGEAKVGDAIAVIGKPGDDISGLLASLGSPAPSRAAPTGPATPPSPSRAARKAGSEPTATTTAAIESAPSARLRASPLARRLATERGLDLGSIRGSGPEGRIVRRDVETARGAATTIGRASPPALQPGPGDEVLPVSRMRQIIARRLSDSMFSAPHFYLTVAVTMDTVLAARARMNAGRERKLSLNAFLMALAGRTLTRHAQVNSTWNGDTLLRHATADIGLAVALPDGLVTPVVRDCGRKGIGAIDAELVDLVERARAGALAPEEYSGATFTISNLGAAGIDEFTAIINPPGSAILAVGAVRKEPVVEEGAGGEDSVVVRQRMHLTLSCDHRVVDGAVGAAFLRDLADTLENPLLALA